MGALAGCELIKPSDAADDAATEEANQQYENDTKHQFPDGTESEGRLKEVLQVKPDRRANQGSKQCSSAADRRLHHKLAGRVEGKCIGRHEGLQDAKQAAGKTGVGGSDHKCRQLVAMDIMTDRAGA